MTDWAASKEVKAKANLLWQHSIIQFQSCRPGGLVSLSIAMLVSPNCVSWIFCMSINVRLVGDLSLVSLCDSTKLAVTQTSLAGLGGSLVPISKIWNSLHAAGKARCAHYFQTNQGFSQLHHQNLQHLEGTASAVSFCCLSSTKFLFCVQLCTIWNLILVFGLLLWVSTLNFSPISQFITGWDLSLSGQQTALR